MQFNLKFRQRINAKGDYHYWGQVGGIWVEPNNAWGIVGYSEQWTGLEDKDDVEIYAGDILEYWNGQTALVVFENGSFVTKDNWYYDVGCGGSLWQNMEHITKDCKVIGNIGNVFYPKKITKNKRPKTPIESRKKKTT